MGALVLLTALLASCSGGYAIFTIFHDMRVTLTMGALWGLMILTLDRFLISSTRKLAVMRDFNREPAALRPYAHQNPWAPLAVRLPLAIAIGVVVSVPIEVRLLQPWINQAERAQSTAAINKISEDFENGKKELDQKNLELKELGKEIDSVDQLVTQEILGKGSQFGPHCGDVCHSEQEREENLKIRYENLRRDIDTREHVLQDERGRREKAAGNDTSAREQERSIISDLAIIHKLAAGDMPNAKDISPVVVKWVWVSLTTLFVLIECIPVLAKAMSGFDPYDATLQEIEHCSALDSLVESRRKYAEASLSD
jgi:hypothetical protein